MLAYLAGLVDAEGHIRMYRTADGRIIVSRLEHRHRLVYCCLLNDLRGQTSVLSVSHETDQ